jgi:hypothetical protein
MYFNVNSQERIILNIICEMRFEDKTYGLFIFNSALVAYCIATKK